MNAYQATVSGKDNQPGVMIIGADSLDEAMKLAKTEAKEAGVEVTGITKIGKLLTKDTVCT